MKLSDGQRRGIAGGLLAILFGSWAIKCQANFWQLTLCLGTGFLAGYIAYAPISFLKAVGEAWKSARGWKLRRTQKRRIERWILSCVKTMYFYSFLLYVPLIVGVFGNHMSYAETSGMTIAAIMFCSLFVGSITTGTKDNLLPWRKCNFFTAWYWLLVCICWVCATLASKALKLMKKAPAWSVKQVQDFGRFLVRFTYQLFALTADNGRLMTGASIVVGILVGLWWQKNVWFMGGTTSLLGYGSWKLAQVITGHWPEPQKVTA